MQSNLVLFLLLLERPCSQTFHLSMNYAGQQRPRDKFNEPEHDVMGPIASSSRINTKPCQSGFDKDIGSGNIDARSPDFAHIGHHMP